MYPWSHPQARSVSSARPQDPVLNRTRLACQTTNWTDSSTSASSSSAPSPSPSFTQTTNGDAFPILTPPDSRRSSNASHARSSAGTRQALSSAKSKTAKRAAAKRAAPDDGEHIYCDYCENFDCEDPRKHRKNDKEKKSRGQQSEVLRVEEYIMESFLGVKSLTKLMPVNGQAAGLMHDKTEILRAACALFGIFVEVLYLKAVQEGRLEEFQEWCREIVERALKTGEVRPPSLMFLGGERFSLCDHVPKPPGKSATDQAAISNRCREHHHPDWRQCGRDLMARAHAQWVAKMEGINVKGWGVCGLLKKLARYPSNAA